MTPMSEAQDEGHVKSVRRERKGVSVIHTRSEITPRGEGTERTRMGEGRGRGEGWQEGGGE